MEAAVEAEEVVIGADDVVVALAKGLVFACVAIVAALDDDVGREEAVAVPLLWFVMRLEEEDDDDAEAEVFESSFAACNSLKYKTRPLLEIMRIFCNMVAVGKERVRVRERAGAREI